ncbi:MAG: CPBP family intramembrane metalloprotease [Rhodospirillales bacterium]|nr:CPBP family intramembrane metalloprotease [Rhodospirillales bacterium]
MTDPIETPPPDPAAAAPRLTLLDLIAFVIATGALFALLMLGLPFVDPVELAMALGNRPEAAMTSLALLAATFIAPALAVAAATVRHGSLALPLLGFRRFHRGWWWRAVAISLAVVAVLDFGVLGAAEWLFDYKPDLEVERFMQSVTTTAADTAVALLVAGLFGPFVEELVFRGLVFGYVRARFGYRPALVVSTLLFAAAHMEVVHVLLVVPSGLAFGWLRERSGSIWPCVIGHAATNILAVLMTHLFR